jgi:hypothetical protein
MLCRKDAIWLGRWTELRCDSVCLPGEHTRPGCGGTRPAFRCCARHRRERLNIPVRSCFPRGAENYTRGACAPRDCSLRIADAGGQSCAATLSACAAGTLAVGQPSAPSSFRRPCATLGGRSPACHEFSQRENTTPGITDVFYRANRIYNLRHHLELCPKSPAFTAANLLMPA